MPSGLRTSRAAAWGVVRAGDIGDELPQRRVAAVAPWPGGAAGTAARQHRAEQRRQRGDGVGVPAARGGIVHAAGVAEQFPDGDGVVGEPHGAQVIVGGVVEAHPAFGGEPQDGDGGDEPGDPVGGEPVIGAQRLGPVQVGPASRDGPVGPARRAAGQHDPGQAQLREPRRGGLGRDRRDNAGAGGGRCRHTSIGDLASHRVGPEAAQLVRRPGLRVGFQLRAAGPGAGVQRVVLGDHELFAQARGDAGKLSTILPVVTWLR